MQEFKMRMQEFRMQECRNLELLVKKEKQKINIKDALKIIPAFLHFCILNSCI